MFILYLFILVLMLYGIKFHKGGFYDDYMGKAQCNAIKGIFILIVFVRHVVPYTEKTGHEMSSALDKAYNFLDGQIGQLLVVMFLFYSGFGVMESIKRKGNDYIRRIPKHRVLTTLINFDIAVSLYLLMDFAFDINVTSEKYFLSRFGWESIGNSNWYIFIILLLYLLTFFSFRISQRRGYYLLFIMSIITIAVLYFVKMPLWYNTLLSYPAGVMFSIYKEKFEYIVKRHYLRSMLIVIVLFFVFHTLNFIIPAIIYAYAYNIESILFALLIVILLIKISVNNSILTWLGMNLFPLYIYQRIPMIAMRELASAEWLCMHPYLFISISLTASIMITYLYKYWRISI